MTGESAVPRVRPMTIADVAAVTALERAAFSEGWSATAFAREIEENAMARYVVLETPGPEAAIVGFAGIWLMVDEAHVVTVAVDPAKRGQGYGRTLVHTLVLLAANLGMENATLECRVSNDAARALYRDYGFYEVGTRRAYYADNQEDAVIMTTEAFESSAYRERLGRLEARLPLTAAALAASIGSIE